MPHTNDQLRRKYRKRTVPMRLLEGSSLAPPVTVPVVFHGHCGHVTTVCSTCAGDWENDYEIWWANTPAGESLKRIVDTKRMSS